MTDSQTAAQTPPATAAATTAIIVIIVISIAIMDFGFDVNELFPEEISAVGNDLVPAGYAGRLGHGQVQQRVEEVLDVVGERSAQAQGLRQAITSGKKFRQTQDQTAYLLVDRFGNGGRGSVVGLLKVGRRKLFLLDQQGTAHEMVPFCVLDFYVAERMQRSGHGRRLFEAVLAREGIDPRYMAVDRPSVKLLSFLKKHYGLVQHIPQVFT